MKFERLRVRGLRCLGDVLVEPGAGLNVFLGSNGAGKTSLLEAAYLLSYGRSFRHGSRGVLKQQGAERMHVYGEVCDAKDRVFRLGLGTGAGAWELHINGDPGQRLGDLVRHCAVVCFEPGSHALIWGSAQVRRRFVDWGVFHVERHFLPAWQRYKRALKQRNTLLRGPEAPGSAALDPWEAQMDHAAQQVHTARRRYLEVFEPHLRATCMHLLPELGDMTLVYRPGWDDSAVSLAETLIASRETDRRRGYTTAGIHRADWRMGFTHAPEREQLSRGQEKLCALACVLAQARVYAGGHGEWPIICLDDLASELDAPHQASVLARLQCVGAQVWITGTTLLPGLPTEEVRMFHVEHGAITPAPRPPRAP